MKILIVIAALALSACSDAPGATKALLDAGYKNIQTTGYSAFSCGEHDSYSTGFTAVGPTGRPVAGVVCAGVFKGETIRLF